MKRKTVYLVFCVLGILLPYSQFVPWVVAHHGVPLGLLLRELFANRIGGFFGMDVLVTSVLLISFVQREGKPGHAAPLAADCRHVGGWSFPGLSFVSLLARRRLGKHRRDGKRVSGAQSFVALGRIAYTAGAPYAGFARGDFDFSRN